MCTAPQCFGSDVWETSAYGSPLPLSIAIEFQKLMLQYWEKITERFPNAFCEDSIANYIPKGTFVSRSFLGGAMLTESHSPTHSRRATQKCVFLMLSSHYTRKLHAQRKQFQTNACE